MVADDAIAVRVDHLTKRFCAYNNNKQRVLDWLSAGRANRGRWVTALDDISFRLERGRALAVIGPNGAGKSTLLKIVAGTLRPSSGTVECHGRVGALLELGMGFHPEFTGRENIRLNGLLLGLSKDQIRRSESRIVAFSELGEVIDQPLRTYSSGMEMRLGYSVAVAAEPDILVVDEALAVGDAYFQQKCFDHLERFLGGGGAVLFVSHDPHAVLRICDRAILLDGGKLIHEGPPAEVLEVYSARLARSAGGAAGATVGGCVWTGSGGTRAGQFRAVIEDAELRTVDGRQQHTFVTGCEVELLVRGLILYPLESLTAGMMIRDRTGADVFGTNSAELGQPIPCDRPGAFEVRFRFRLDLAPAPYTITVALHAGEQHLAGCYDWADRLVRFRVVPDPTRKFSGLVRLPTSLAVSEPAPVPADRFRRIWARLLAAAPGAIDLAAEECPWLLFGFHEPERDAAGAFRWCGAWSLFAIRLVGRRVLVELDDAVPRGAAEPLTVEADIAGVALGAARLDPGKRQELAWIVPEPWRGQPAIVRLRFDRTCCPAREGVGDDARILSAKCRRIEAGD